MLGKTEFLGHKKPHFSLFLDVVTLMGVSCLYSGMSKLRRELIWLI